ncbi:helix-turn-helix domain-containing protein [Shewanella sp. 10N.286.48.B5]|uniref:helix-turn-helix domain-containing protein n=1 Tax=Shewanella sp. 10N.286.48.B5 TaxID=1880834 RepID=UPI000C83A3DD|nr:helix-turn-helix domain-containing protein [Shewanella sp. 10N.286.48.B5]PMH85524.1 AraC family transcriptional regulator [Shewanella sp. 10N.286.48.B5]
MNGIGFLEALGVSQTISIFELLPDIRFWIKDTQSQIIYANKVYLESTPFFHLEQIQGKTDYDFFPHYLANQYIVDDMKVMKGEVVIDRLEMNILKNGDLAWFSTTKRPLFDENKMIIGSMGFTRNLAHQSQLDYEVQHIKVPVEYMQQHFKSAISIQSLAELSHISVSALERRFKKYLGKTPKQFLNELRLERARRYLIETDLPIADIAHECGFAEPSYFTKQFKALFGELPSTTRTMILAKL